MVTYFNAQSLKGVWGSTEHQVAESLYKTVFC
jgi:hypothetical protein